MRGKAGIMIRYGAMHMFDSLVSAPIAISSAVLAGGAFAYASYRTRKTLPAARTPMLGLSAAFIFAAQMLNFPVAGGSSGHLLGAALAAILLGPSAAIIAVSAVIILQCFLFADGGISTLGANVFNMGVVGVIVAYCVFRAITALFGERSLPVAAGLAGWCSVMAAAAVCAGQIALSGHASPRLVFGGMLGIHALIGVGEGLITAMVVSALAKARPELLRNQAPHGSSIVPVMVFGLLLALGLAIFVSPFACSWPDGLETVAGRVGIDAANIKPIWHGLMPDYQSNLISSQAISTAVAGALGTIAVFIVAWLGVRLMIASRARPQAVRETASTDVH